jgi:hypothetical protein
MGVVPSLAVAQINMRYTHYLTVFNKGLTGSGWRTQLRLAGNMRFA